MARSTNDDDELDPIERQVLDAWTPLAPPAGFADRVLAASEPAEPKRRARWPLVAGALATCAAAIALVVAVRDPSRAASGLVEVDERTQTRLGDRAVIVAEPDSKLQWRVDDDGAATIEQRAGDVFYRVERGEPFVVHTPAGTLRVTGTCFRIALENPMSISHKTKQMIVSGTLGAAVATAVVVTVYEGHVIAETRSGKTELGPGTSATLDGNGRASVASASPANVDHVIALAPIDERATREQLLAQAASQRAELVKLKSRLAELEDRRGGHHDNTAEPGRPWHDPSPETLAAWVGECHVRADMPDLDNFKPSTKIEGKNSRGIKLDELDDLNAAFGELQAQWKQLVRSLYIEATGDAAGADTLSIEAMRTEIQRKSAPNEHNLILQKLARERAGLQAPPADLSTTSPLERLMRALVQLGDQTEAAVAKRLGPERAKELRGDGWGSRSDWSGCPD